MFGYVKKEKVLNIVNEEIAFYNGLINHAIEAIERYKDKIDPDIYDLCVRFNFRNKMPMSRVDLITDDSFVQTDIGTFNAFCDQYHALVQFRYDLVKKL